MKQLFFIGRRKKVLEQLNESNETLQNSRINIRRIFAHHVKHHISGSKNINPLTDRRLNFKITRKKREKEISGCEKKLESLLNQNIIKETLAAVSYLWKNRSDKILEQMNYQILTTQTQTILKLLFP